ncbi:MAG: ribosome maturation factor RimM [Lachnospiraceae bacterium]|jgi:16S rRNA processing protein RimM|nr:ribosome maturation factor RimM [Lachnospiraceae bacterium]
MAELTQEFRVGVIARPHGVHGEVCVFPTTDDPGRFRELEEVILETPREGRKNLKIRGVKYVKKFVILKFEGIDTVEQVERYRSCPLYVTRENAVPLGEGEYYVADVIGLTVLEEESGRELGTVTDVIETGANDVYEMKTTDGKNVLIPAIKECVRLIDPEQGIMKIHIMKGLMP